MSFSLSVLFLTFQLPGVLPVAFAVTVPMSLFLLFTCDLLVRSRVVSYPSL